MRLKKVEYFYFSPTNTTKKIVEEIVKGIGVEGIETNLTFIDKNQEKYEVEKDNLVIVGIPVYGGRVPEIILETLKNIKGSGNLAIPVVVYGNRAYEDALLELGNILKENNFRIFAGGAFIGEHSYTKKVGTGRPDNSDLEKAFEFGKKIYEKAELNETEVKLPGNFPYKPSMPVRIFAPNINNNCVYCRKCPLVCPVGAIDTRYPDKVDIEKCIHCYACIKICQFNGREVKDNPVKPIIEMLETKFTSRKEPEIYL